MEKTIYKISEIGEVVGGGTPSTSNAEFWGGDIPWISPKDLTGYTSMYISHGENFLTSKGLKSGTRLLPKNTVLFSSRAPIGYVAIASNPICTNQGFKSVICKKEIVIPQFLYYYIKANLNYIKLFGTGATFPEISGAAMKKIKVALPHLPIQKKIASILSTYDTLIENNTKRIRLLEQMAENLYKEWFVRFRFPGHENVEMENGLPKGWKHVRLGEISDYAGKQISKSDVDLEKDVYIPIDCIPNRRMAFTEMAPIADAESSLQRFSKGDILFGAMRVYFHKVIIAPKNGVTRSTCFIFRPKNIEYKHYLYLILYQDSTIDYANTISVGATMPYVRKNDFLRMHCVLPPINIINKFNKIIEPMMREIVGSHELNLNLTRQRDLLLPRLMSGKLEVKP